MRSWLRYFGLFLPTDDSDPYTINIHQYKTTSAGKVNAHIELLKSLEKKEDDRLTTIDSKTSQIVTYTGIIFSALSIFIPILLDKIPDHALLLRIAFIIVLILAFIFYVLTIHNALRNYDIGKFHYSRSDPRNVIKYQGLPVNKFTAIEIQDLLYGYNQNSKTNDEKASNLIYAYRSFRVANVLTAIMGILICVSLLFIKQGHNEVVIRNPVQIRNVDSTSKVFIENLKPQESISIIKEPPVIQYHSGKTRK